MNKILKLCKKVKGSIYRYLLNGPFAVGVEWSVSAYYYYKKLLCSPFRKGDIRFSEKRSDIRILYITYYDPKGIITVSQTIEEYVDKSDYTIDVLNLYHKVPLIKKRSLQQYDCILVHNTMLYAKARMKLVGKLFLGRFDGVKAAMKQDEHYHTNLFSEFIKKYHIDLVLTLWDEKTAAKVYPVEECPKLHIMQFLTGYVPDSYRTMQYDLGNRVVDVGYRGSLQPLLFGNLAYEKREIGDRFLQYAEQYGLKCDISSLDEKRITGADWLNFLGTCKATLSVESGSSIVDVDGNVEKQYHKFKGKHPRASERDILCFLQQFEKDIQYRVIAPRHFEAAACRTLQIMYEGEYQGIFVPYRHYVPLKRDFSNIEEVVNILLDDERRKRIVNCAYDEIIKNDKYSFSYFVKRLDEAIQNILSEKNKELS